MDIFAELFDPKSIQREDAAMNMAPEVDSFSARKERIRFPEAVANVEKLINNATAQLEADGEPDKAKELRLSWRRILQG